MPADRARRRFRPDIEGLRAVAVLLVVLYHAGVPGLPGGFVGVDVFFVISGFLITGLLASELVNRGRISFRGFYARRARRILPAATLVTIATVTASSVLLSPLAARSVDNDGLAAALFGINYRLAAGGSNYLTASLPPSPLQHYWSLSVEEQFYVLWPLLLVAASLAWARRRAPVGRGGSRDDVVSGVRRVSVRSVAVALSVIAVVSFVASVSLTSSSPAWAYYSLWTRAWELALGGLVALAAPALEGLPGRLATAPILGRRGLAPLLGRRGLAPLLGRRGLATALGWGGLSAIVGAAALFGSSTPFPGTAALLPVLGAAAVIVAGTVGASPETAAVPGSAEPVSDPQPTSSAQWALGLRPVRAVGRWSYSWYLWHFPLLVLVPAAVGHPLSLPEALAVAAVALGAAAATYSFVEQPARRAAVLVRRPALALGLGAVLMASTVSAGLAAAEALPSLQGLGAPAHLGQRPHLTAAELRADLVRGLAVNRVPRNLTPPLDTASTDLPIVYSDGCHAPFPATTNPACVFGDTSSRLTVVLFGDSHAAQWFPGLDAISKGQHWRLVSLTKSGCPPVEVTVTHSPGTVPYPECDTWRSYALHRIAAMRPQVVITSWDRGLASKATAEPGVPKKYSTVWADGVAALLRSLVATKATVIVLGNTPSFPYEVPGCVAGHLKEASRCTLSRAALIPFPALRRAEESIAKADHVPLLDPLGWFCAPKACPVIVGNLLLYRDGNHMVPEWSKFMAPVVLHALKPLFPKQPG